MRIKVSKTNWLANTNGASIYVHKRPSQVLQNTQMLLITGVQK